MATYPKVIPLAATSGSAIIESVQGFVTAVRVERSAGTPTITLAETSGTQEAIIAAQAFAANATKTPQKEIEEPDGTATGLRMPFYVNGSLTVTITGATNPSTITIYVKTVS